MEESQLRSTLKGEVIVSSDRGYDEARKVWNGMIDRHPSAVLRCTNTNDIITALRFARERGVSVAVRGGGHNVAGFGTCDYGIVIDLSRMKRIEVDPKAKLVRAQPGLTWGDFDRATQEHGLATTGGLVSTTGIAGFTLGGGIGWLVRQHGLTIDNLVSVEMVTADGSVVRASDTENPELLWGVKGGGGNFGIITSFEYRLHAVGPLVYGGAFFFPVDRAEEVLRTYSSIAHGFPDELTTLVAFLTAPPAPFIPQPIQGTKMIAIALCYNGPAETGAEVVSPLRMLKPSVDLVGPIPYLELQKMFDAGSPFGIRAYWKTSYLKELSDGAIRTLVSHASKMVSPLSQLHIHHLGGAVSRTSGGGCFAHRDTPFVLNFVGEWVSPAEDASNITWVRDAWEGMKPYSTGTPYVNFLGSEGGDQVRAAYGENYARLAELKRKYDPENFFKINQNIKPS